MLASTVSRIGNGEKVVIAARSGGALGRLERAVNSLQKELDLLRIQAQLKGMEKAWQDIARVMAHEIKNPLTPIRLTLDRMEEKAAAGDSIDAATSQKFCSRMADQVDALERLVNQFQSFSKEPDIRPLDTDIVAAIRGVADSMVDRIATSIDGSSTVRTDPYLFNQIVLNIWKNAMEAGASRVSVQITEASGVCSLTIKDNGPGIAPDLLEKIWLPYVSFKKGGTGLGLPVVKKLVETLGGTIRLTSRVEGSDTGLTLHLSIPATRDSSMNGDSDEILYSHR